MSFAEERGSTFSSSSRIRVVGQEERESRKRSLNRETAAEEAEVRYRAWTSYIIGEGLASMSICGEQKAARVGG